MASGSGCNAQDRNNKWNGNLNWCIQVVLAKYVDIHSIACFTDSDVIKIARVRTQNCLALGAKKSEDVQKCLQLKK